MAEGEITPDQAKAHYSRQVMNQHLGCGFCEPETDGFSLTEGDLQLLSTDGLYQSVPKGQLERLLNGHTCTEDTVRALLKAALDAGGRDNITGVAVKMKETAHPATHSGRQGPLRQEMMRNRSNLRQRSIRNSVKNVHINDRRLIMVK